MMEYVNLGKTGLRVSRLCLGCMSYGATTWRSWVLDEETSRPFFRQALESGINFFDTANAYSLGVSEEITGRALRDMANRDEIVVATKVYFAMSDKPNMGGLSRKHILSAIDASLRRLGMDYVDLYQIHRFDPHTPIEETLEALHDVVRAGKARYIGASSMHAYQFAKMLFTQEKHGWARFVSMQNHYNLIYREEEREMIPLCQEEGIGLIPWSPLARGFLTGNRLRTGERTTQRAKDDPLADQFYFRDVDFDIAGRVGTVAQKHGVQPAQIALAWLLNKSYITAPIIGATKPHQLDELVAALQIKLSADEIQFIEALYQPRELAGHR